MLLIPSVGCTVILRYCLHLLLSSRILLTRLTFGDLFFFCEDQKSADLQIWGCSLIITSLMAVFLCLVIQGIATIVLLKI